MNTPNAFGVRKQAELDRWTKWWRALSGRINRSLHVLDTIENMDEDSPDRPSSYSTREAALIADELLPIAVEMAEFASSPEEAAQLLRDAASRIET